MARSTINKPADSQDSTYSKSLDKSVPTSPYTLVFLDAAKNAPEGTEKVIDAPYVSLGRDTDCLICYGDEFPMVSRLHAAIEWSEDNYSIRHLSNTNQTLLNGRPIARKWFLHDDDVIQLAPSGPKIKFKRPLILNMKPAGAPAKNDLTNTAVIALIVLAVLFTILMVYLTVAD